MSSGTSALASRESSVHEITGRMESDGACGASRVFPGEERTRLASHVRIYSPVISRDTTLADRRREAGFAQQDFRPRAVYLNLDNVMHVRRNHHFALFARF